MPRTAPRSVSTRRSPDVALAQQHVRSVDREREPRVCNVGGVGQNAEVIGIGSFWGALPTEGRWLLSTVAIQTLGRGLTLPFTIIYLHEVRGFDLGALRGADEPDRDHRADRDRSRAAPSSTGTGREPCCSRGSTAMIAGCTLLAFATHPAVAAVALVLIGVNFGVSWPGFNALIAAVVDGDLRQQYFGVNFALVNLGIGIGGIIGGFYVDVRLARDVHRDLPRRRGQRASSRWPCCSGRCDTCAPRPSPPTMRHRPAATARSSGSRRCCGSPCSRSSRCSSATARWRPASRPTRGRWPRSPPA